MSDDFVKTKEGEEPSFAELMEAYQDGRGDTIRLGDRITGKVISIGRDTVFVDTGTKVDGVVEKGELLDEKGMLPYGIGDTLELYVVSFRGDEVKLSKGLSKTGGTYALRGAFEKSVPVEGKVNGLTKGGFQVEVMKKRAFCPMGQMELGFMERPEEHIGKTYLFLITQFEEGGRNIVVSRRELLKAEQAKSREVFLKTVMPEALFDGRVTKVMPYGVFVELFPGVEGMVHVSELSWSRSIRTDEVVKKDELLRVKVIGIEGGAATDSFRISLSAKQVTTDPWDHLEERYHVGNSLKGRVTRCAKFGAFVELEPGIEGLVHVSEISYRKRVTNPEEIVRPGDEVQVLVKELDPSKRRIALSMKDAEGDPWIGVETRFHEGLVVKGVIERKERFGYLVALEPGIIGLIPKSRMTESSASGHLERLREGDTVSVVVEAVHPEERKITLGVSDAMEEADWRRFKGAGGKSLGSLGERLQDALNSKKGNSRR